MEGSDQNQQRQLRPQERDSLGGRIMLTAIAALFAAIIIVLFFHIYVRWHIRRARRRRVAILLTTGDPSPPTRSAPRGLDLGLVQSLPITTRSASGGPIDCAVCLSEVEEGEKLRILPKCGHGFHVECIDTWFFHHSTCPLCRAGVEAAAPEPPPRAEIMPTACDCCGASSSSRGMVGIEEPPRRIEELGLGFGFGASGGRIVTLKRLLSRDRRLYSGRVLDSDGDLEIGGGASPHPPAPPTLARRGTELRLDGRRLLN